MGNGIAMNGQVDLRLPKDLHPISPFEEWLLKREVIRIKSGLSIKYNGSFEQTLRFQLQEVRRQAAHFKLQEEQHKAKLVDQAKLREKLKAELAEQEEKAAR